jgi:hypothetical protein
MLPLHLKKNKGGRPRRLYKKCHYATGSEEEYLRLRQYTQKMVKMKIMDKEMMGIAFKMLAEIMLKNDGVISDGMLIEYRDNMKG